MFGDYCDLNGFGVDAMGVPATKFFVLDSPSWRAVRDYIRSQNWSDEMNANLVRNRTLFAPGVRPMLRGVIGGINVLVSNLIPFATGPAGSGANAGDSERRFIAGTSAAFTAAVADATTVIWPRGRNPKGDGTGTPAGMARDGTLVEYLSYHGTAMVDSRQLRGYTIRGAATGGAN